MVSVRHLAAAFCVLALAAVAVQGEACSSTRRQRERWLLLHKQTCELLHEVAVLDML
jgi:hypothetical protein